MNYVKRTIEEIKDFDPEIANLIEKELNREQQNIELIASENFVSTRVLAAAGSILTNKYAEGYPKKKYYGGCEFVSEIEEVAIKRAKELFNANHVNVQPHSGSQANMAIYSAVLKPGDKIMGQSLSTGGHLTHGFSVNFSGKIYHSLQYTTDEKTGYLDYDKIEKQAKEFEPKLIMCGASAYPREIDFKRFREICDANSCLMASDIAHIAGLVVTNNHQSPFPHSDFVSTTIHKTLRGPRTGMTMCKEAYAKQLDSAVFPGLQGGPLVHIMGAMAIAFKEAQTKEFAQYQTQTIRNAKAMAETFLEQDYDLVTGGTDNHLLLLDLRDKGINGKELEKLLETVNITVNKNTIPNDPLGPMVTSGVRLGSPAMTTRGLKEEDFAELAQLIMIAIEEKNSEIAKEKIRERVKELTERFPLYPD